MFDPVDPKQSLPALEQGILEYWSAERTFHRSMEQRREGERFSFYDGPPFATGLPHYGHILAGTIKDVIPRYQTMKGKFVARRFGWDCHGLPIENMIEKEHKIASKRDIEEMGVAAFNALCRASVQRYAKEWRHTVERMGRWVDMDDDYKTMDASYMEGIWWVFEQLWNKKLVYQGYKPMHVCPRCVTPLSNFEVTQGYKDVTDVSVVVMFELDEDEKLKIQDTKKIKDKSTKTFVLAWTTTPWTLPGNMFLAAHPETMYVTIRFDGKKYIVAEALVENVFKDKEYEVEGKAFLGKKLVGKSYQPLFPYFADQYKDTAFHIVAGDFVTTEEGTGIVHIAPGFGEDDFQVLQAINSKFKTQDSKIPLLQHVTMEGKFIKEVTDFPGEDSKPKDDPTKMDQKIAKWLDAHGALFATLKYKHSYPHCWRCDTPLLNYATSSWFVAVEKIKDAMLTANQETEWVPSHLRDGRFGRWLEGARDWAISRNRYWGTPLPIWKAGKGTLAEMEVVGSRDELMRRQLVRFTKISAVRHGESHGNIAQKYQGSVPGTDLTERGRKQAKEAGEILVNQEVAVIYCSPLARAMQTAEAIAHATGAKVIVDERLRELEFGKFEGKEFDHSDAALMAAKNAHKLEEGTPESLEHFAGMETWSALSGRVHHFLLEILPKHRSDHIVIVSHGDPLTSIKEFFTKEEIAKLAKQPDPGFATPVSYFWDHDREAAMDLHKDVVDDITWMGPQTEESVELTLVRHGQTNWNKQGIVQGGDGDEPLNEEGRAQAHALAKELKGKKFDVILSSDLARARETAEIIAKELGVATGKPWSEFKERKAGEWSGKKREEILAQHPPLFEGNTNVAFHYPTPHEGESLSTFLKRVRHATSQLLKEYAGKNVLLVTHRGTVQALRAFAENLSYSEAAKAELKNGTAMTITLNPLYERTEEVFDCWFESGSMPYATTTPTLTLPRGERAGFPADFIAENLDQTRGWFYTLMVLSSALYGTSAFRHCICGGMILAEDGKKMSKRLNNYPDPNELMDRQGADALRFALMSSPVVRAEELRFSEKSVEEVVRRVLLPLWNCYSFFVTYANAAKFEVSETRSHSGHPLDLYVRSEVQDLVNRMTKQLDAYDLSATCKELEETIDALTNWYIRLSRRRFAGKGGIDSVEAEPESNESNQHEALLTLHGVLLTISQLLAPFCPFIAEAMYLNLTGEEHGSVHLSDWPEVRTLSKEEEHLLTKNRVLRTVVSLGLRLRSEYKIKTRQPLSKATVAVPPALLKKSPFAEEDLDLLRQELNVKEIALRDDPGSMGSRIALVNARKVGPRLGGRVQEIIAAGKRGEFEEQEDGFILILDEALSPDEVTISYQGCEGQNIAAEGGIVVSLTTEITDELKAEGSARDVIRAIQKLRKDEGFAITDHITIALSGADEILNTYRTLIEQETNTQIADRVDGKSHLLTLDDGSSITLSL